VKHLLTIAALALLAAVSSTLALAGESAWIDLIGSDELDAWEGPNDGWIVAGDAALDPEDARALAAKPGRGVLVSILKGRADFRNLTSKQTFADIEVHLEFLVPKGSNAGVKFEGLYEIQIADSHGKAKPTASDCGGVYPRAELRPRYQPAGEWQTLDVVFRAPRFDAEGNKTENARFVRVVLNGQVIHEDVPLECPTGHAWRKEKEMPRGPLFLQGDHGPVAYRNVRVRPLDEPKE
jgi:hypothetical protein